METALKLIMTFKSQGDKAINLTIDDPKDDLTESEIRCYEFNHREKYFCSI